MTKEVVRLVSTFQNNLFKVLAKLSRVITENTFKIKGEVFVNNFPKEQKVTGVISVPEVKDEIKRASEKIGKAIVDNKPNEVFVKNFPRQEKIQFPKSISVNNFPKTINVGNLNDYTKELLKIVKTIENLPSNIKIDLPKQEKPVVTVNPVIKQEKVEFKVPESFVVKNIEKTISNSPKKYVPVRLTDGEDFYDAFSSAVSNVSAYRSASGVNARGLVDDSGHVQVNVVDVVPTEGNNPAISISNDDEVVDSTTVITKTIGEKSYQKTLSFNAGGDLISVSAWSEV